MKKRGPESQKNHETRLKTGFYKKYMSGRGLDIGYKGNGGRADDTVPVLDTAIGIDMDYPMYDGKTLPFPEAEFDYVYASHVLEHVEPAHEYIADWFRVLKPGGHLVIAVPHQDLYERKGYPPSKWNPGGHKRFYRPYKLLREIEMSLGTNTYRIRHFRDNDEGYDYTVPLDEHPRGAYEIECVIEKLKNPPNWEEW